MIFKAPTPDDREELVMQQIDNLRDRLNYATLQPKRWFGILRRNAFAKAVRGSNSIEGYNVTIDDAIAAVEGEEPLEPKDEAWLAVSGYRTAMTFVLQKADDGFFTFSAELLKALHFMMISYDLSKHPGRWRPGSIAVRDETTGERVYEGPPVESVPSLIDELLDAMNAEPGRNTSNIIRAAMAHLNLVMIHPFSDGNGRMGRCLQTLVLARGGVTAPFFSSIEEYLGRNTQAYYDVLAAVGNGAWHPERDARRWIRFCLTAHYRQAMTLLKRTREIEALCDDIEVIVKRAGLPERSVLALADAALGYRVRNATYRNTADVTTLVAGRDLLALARAGLLEPKGEKRGRYYIATQQILAIRRKLAEPKSIPDPFAKVGEDKATSPDTPQAPRLPGIDADDD